MFRNGFLLHGGKHGTSATKVLAEKKLSVYDNSDVHLDSTDQMTPDTHFNHLFIFLLSVS